MAQSANPKVPPSIVAERPSGWLDLGASSSYGVMAAQWSCCGCLGQAVDGAGAVPGSLSSCTPCLHQLAPHSADQIRPHQQHLLQRHGASASGHARRQRRKEANSQGQKRQDRRDCKGPDKSKGRGAARVRRRSMTVSPHTGTSSGRCQAHIVFLHVGIDCSCSLSGARFEELCWNYLCNSMGPIEQCLGGSGVGMKSVHDLVLHLYVSGAVRDPRGGCGEFLVDEVLMLELLVHVPDDMLLVLELLNIQHLYELNYKHPSRAHLPQAPLPRLASIACWGRFPCERLGAYS